MQQYQKLLEEAFAAKHDRVLITGVQQGVLLANAAIENEIFLRTLIGQDLRGHLRRAAVLFRVHELCQSGDLPFLSQMSRMPRGGGHWVELRSMNFKAHVCRTDGPAAFPDDTPTRQDERRTNQLDLNLDAKVIPIRPALQDLDEMYAWLTFGAVGDELTHLCWGMPAARHEEWLARINVLRRSQEAGLTAPPSPSAKTVLRFREHIEDALRDATSEAKPDIQE